MSYPGARIPGSMIDRLLECDPITPRNVDDFMWEKQFPLVEGNQVTFAFRGEADAVRLMHFIYGLETAQPFHRVPGTDFWYVVMELPPGSRVEYKLEIQRGDHREWIRDPLNPHLARDPYGANSVCQGEGYERPVWTYDHPDTRSGALDHLVLSNTPFGDSRRVTVYLPARYRETRRYRLLVVHDGGDYMKYAAMRTVLDNLIDDLEVAPLIVALTHPHDRLTEYPDDQRHAAFVVEQLLPTLADRYPLLDAPAARGLMGASFGAVA